MKTFLSIQRTAVLAGLLFLAASVHAADSSWTNTAGGSFTDPGNWDNGVPGTTDVATFGQGSATYTVNVTGGNVTNFLALVTNSNQNVIWDLGGNVYRIANGYGSGNYAVRAFLNPGDSGTLTIANGTLQADYGNYGVGFNAPNGTIIVTNGGFVRGTSTSISTLIIDGVGSGWSSYDYTGINSATVRNGAGVEVFRGGVIQNLMVDNAAVTNNGGLAGSGGTITVTNGGLISQYFPVGSIYNGAQWIGYDDAPLAQLNIGGGTDMTQTNIFEGDAFAIGRYWTDSGRGQVNIATNGIMRIRWNAHPTPRYNFPAANDGYTDFWAKDGDVVTLNGGRIEMYQGSKMDLANFPSTVQNPAILRGIGALTKIGGTTTNWTLTNDGWIKPGDTSATPSIGALSVASGDLVQTSTGTSFFDFDPSAPGSSDRIDITNGTATVAGSIQFTNLISSSLTYGTWDFLIADDIIYTGSDNMAALLGTLTMPGPTDITFGVVNVGGRDILRLEVMIPEPSTVMLLGLGGLLVTRATRRRA